MKIRLLRKEISRRLTTTFLLIALLFSLMFFSFERNRYNHSLNTIKDSLSAVIDQKIEILANNLFFKNTRALSTLIEQIMEYQGIIDVELYDSKGELFIASQEKPLLIDLKVLEQSLADKFMKRELYEKKQSLTYIVPLFVASDLNGYITVHYDLHELLKQIHIAILFYIILISTLFIGTTLILRLFLSRLILQPLDALSAGMSKVSSGELGVQISIESKNELTGIVQVFNKMSLENKDMYTKLQDINVSLESQVNVRTSELQKSESLLQSVLNSSLDSIMVLKSLTDTRGKIVDFKWVLANPEAAAIFSSKVSSIIGNNLLSEVPSIKNSELFSHFQKTADTGAPLDKEFYCEFENLRGWYHVTAVEIDKGIAVTFRDITRQKLLEQDLQKRAHLDGLTALANRAYLDEYFEKYWLECREAGQPLAAVMIDVDYFKPYNDSYGHQQGDACLQALSEVLAENTSRPRDFASRYGGEEFILTLPGSGEKSVEKLCRKIKEDIARLAIPHMSSDVSEFVTVSMGAAVIVPDTRDYSELIRIADQMLYSSKTNGRNRYEITVVD